MGKFLTAKEKNILNVGLLVSYPVLPGIYLYQMRKSQYEMKMMAKKNDILWIQCSKNQLIQY